MNREQWLTKATTLLTKTLFTPNGYAVPALRVSVGWPSTGGTASKNRTIGQCWHPEATADKVPQLFISPVLDDPIQVLGTLTHEVIHAVLPTGVKHGGQFRQAMLKVGLEGKPTATSVGPDLLDTLGKIAGKLGEYPHKAVKPGVRGKTQTTRLIKAECDRCGYTVRVTRKWLEAGNPHDDYAEAGAPICPIDRVQMIADY